MPPWAEEIRKDFIGEYLAFKTRKHLASFSDTLFISDLDYYE